MRTVLRRLRFWDAATTATMTTSIMLRRSTTTRNTTMTTTMWRFPSFLRWCRSRMNSSAHQAEARQGRRRRQQASHHRPTPIATANTTTTTILIVALVIAEFTSPPETKERPCWSTGHTSRAPAAATTAAATDGAVRIADVGAGTGHTPPPPLPPPVAAALALLGTWFFLALTFHTC